MPLGQPLPLIPSIRPGGRRYGGYVLRPFDSVYRAELDDGNSNLTDPGGQIGEVYVDEVTTNNWHETYVIFDLARYELAVTADSMLATYVGATPNTLTPFLINKLRNQAAQNGQTYSRFDVDYQLLSAFSAPVPLPAFPCPTREVKVNGTEKARMARIQKGAWPADPNNPDRYHEFWTIASDFHQISAGDVVDFVDAANRQFNWVYTGTPFGIDKYVHISWSGYSPL